MTQVSYLGDEKMREFIDELHNNGINQYISLPGNLVFPRPPLCCDINVFYFFILCRDCCNG